MANTPNDGLKWLPLVAVVPVYNFPQKDELEEIFHLHSGAALHSFNFPLLPFHSFAEEDNEKFLLKLKQRNDRGFDCVVCVLLKCNVVEWILIFPTIEVRFEHLNVDVEAYVGSRELPTIFNFTVNMLEGFLNSIHILPNRKKPLPILHEVSGIIKPGRMTLLLGPSSSGKTMLLLALAGKLGSNLKVNALKGENINDLLETAMLVDEVSNIEFMHV
nr:pleiotropic drug resistance protein 1-like [Ipomoea batatas]